MADNVTITPGTGVTVAADDIGTVLHQRVKLSLGADGSATDALGGSGAVAAGVQRVTLASDDPAVAALGAISNAAWSSGDGTAIALLKAIAAVAVDTSTSSPIKPGARDHETVAASQTDQMCGSTGAAGDVLDGLLIVPATTSPGAVSIEYGATNITVFAGGASSVSNLVPFWVELGSIASVGGGWEITTGTNVSVIAVGDFT